MNRKLVAAALWTGILSGGSAMAQNVPAATQPAPADGKMVVTGSSVVILQREKGTYLGLGTSKARQVLLKQLNIKSGVVVESVVAGSPAEAAGLRVADVIQKIDDQVLINPAQAEALIRLHAPGDGVTLTLLRDGKPTQATAKLIEQDVLKAVDSDPSQLAESGLLANVDLAKLIGPNAGNKITERIMIGGTGGTVRTGTEYSDGKYDFTTVVEGNDRTLTVKKKNGDQIFSGPVNNDDDKKAIPDELRTGFDQMEKIQAKFRPEIEMHKLGGGQP